MLQSKWVRGRSGQNGSGVLGGGQKLTGSGQVQPKRCRGPWTEATVKFSSPLPGIPTLPRSRYRTFGHTHARRLEQPRSRTSEKRVRLFPLPTQIPPSSPVRADLRGSSHVAPKRSAEHEIRVQRCSGTVPELARLRGGWPDADTSRGCRFGVHLWRH